MTKERTLKYFGLASKINIDNCIMNCWLCNFSERKIYFTSSIEGSIKK